MSSAFGRAVRSTTSSVSPLGWVVAGLAVGSWYGAARVGWEELEILALSSILLALFSAAFAVGQLDLTSEISLSPSRVVVGERATGGVMVRSNRRRAFRSIRLELPVGDTVAVFEVPRLGGGETIEELFVVPTHRRAVLPVGPITTVQGDPLGLFRRVRTWADAQEIYIHPRTVPLPAPAAGLVRDMEGRPTGELSPSDVAFHALRDYAPGDDRRHIHWRSSAKLGELLVRQYVDTRRSHVAVALSTDLDDYANDDEFELAISCAASIARQAFIEGQTLSVFAGADQLPSQEPRGLLDRFAGIEGRRTPGADASGASVAGAVMAIRSHASEASVAVVCVGSTLATEGLRRATGWLPAGMTTVVLRAAVGEKRGYHVIGSTTVVNVPDLEQLAVGIRTVVAA